MKMVGHWFILILSFAGAFMWDLSNYDNLTLELLVVLILSYIGLVGFNKWRKQELVGHWYDIFILNTTVLLLITITGNLYSPLYFLLYFLGFGITFVFEPVSVFLYLVCAMIFFVPEALKNGSLESFIRLGSLILISPLAFFFGQEFRKKDQKVKK